MERRVSIIEVSGMVCNAIHMAMHNVELSDKEKSEIEQVKQYIESRKSVKIHFFATEYRYSRKNSKDKDTPEAILTSLVDFWKRKISFVNTIGAYVLVTKCDKILNVGKICSDSLLPTRDNNTTPRHAYEYVKEHLPSFWIHLKEVCNERHIRNVRTVSFSVGEVFAQDLCRFDGRDAEKVINLIVSTASRPNLFVLLWERLYKKSKKEPAYL